MVGIAQRVIYENGAEYEDFRCMCSAKIHEACNQPFSLSNYRKGRYSSIKFIGKN